ncbi:hypothetical protein PPERSA_11583 [Pseudocohnilembus persalinus]|uniref:Uncharacterized protein n=1 Tax=Pseudocohnilembus persalinus TaxID=266149 RepID=A0A0V0Q9S6_PSEPJ|nr:hypothetical protein PPERSA_11583 [Pseudocohnilembus persalinus]|eukprot:KRW98982.1 hypothetical protein PPERSA_11583 [Pseudocohnilembus persalinus]
MDPHKERIKRFMKKSPKVEIKENPSEQEKQEFIKRKLFSTTPEATNFQKSQGQFFSENSQNSHLSLGQKIARKLDQISMWYDGRSFKKFRKETLPFLAFLSFSTFMLYKMEVEYDKMTQSVTKARTQKKIIAEEEDEYIRAHLTPKAKLGENQIQDVPDKRGKYKYEQYDEDDDDLEQGEAGFSTKDDFFELLRKDYNKGINVPEQYLGAVHAYAERSQKKLKYGEEDEEGEEADQEFNLKDDLIVGSGGRGPVSPVYDDEDD